MADYDYDYESKEEDDAKVESKEDQPKEKDSAWFDDWRLLSIYFLIFHGDLCLYRFVFNILLFIYMKILEISCVF